jgi:hypothetical protein
MFLGLPSARRKEGGEQPFIKVGGMFKIRLPIIHAEWEIPEMVQAIVVFVTGVAATAYLQDLFGLTFGTALSIIVVHELLYLLQNLLGDPIVGGWITPSIPITSAFLLTFNEGADRIEALVALQLVLGLLFLVLGFTGLAKKLVDWTPRSVKAGILVGSGIASVIGKYGFMSEEAGGVGFFHQPVAFSIGVGGSLFLLFSFGFLDLKKGKNKLIAILGQAGFVPALLLAFLVGYLVKELAGPVFGEGIIFNPFEEDKLPWVWKNFSIIGIGLPSIGVIIKVVPMALIAYVIAFGDIIAGTEFLKSTESVRQDEIIGVNANMTNVCCGIRNTLQSLFFPTVVLSGPLWSAMTVTIAERYKTGKKNMYSIWGGVITFNFMKVVCCFIVPLTALIQPVLPLSMSITLMIQAVGCFYVAMGMVHNNQERGIAGLVGSILAVAGPAYGLASGIVIAILIQLRSKKHRGEDGEIVGDPNAAPAAPAAANETSAQQEAWNDGMTE